jgi:arylsulfatase A-like enzyme
MKERYFIQRGTTEEQAREFISKTYGAITMIDNGVGKILASLENLGMADNTIVIFTSDHGDLMGDHGMILKGPSPFRGVLNVPLIWRIPGMIKPGSVSDSLISSIDFAPTLMKLLGIKSRNQPPDMQGIDMTPVLKDPSIKARDHCLIEEDEEIFNVKLRLRHLITEDHKITIYQHLRDYGDIFDRKNDPDEINNLWYKDKELRSKLIKKLLYEILGAQSRYPPRVASA